jgi:hypothetical protein
MQEGRRSGTPALARRLASVGPNDSRLESAFAAVERERYGPGPWTILGRL